MNERDWLLVATPRVCSAAEIVDAVCHAAGVTRAHLRGERRAPYVAWCRHLVWHLMNERVPQMSLAQMGNTLNRTDHKTVQYGLRRWPEVRAQWPEMAAMERAARAHLDGVSA